MGRGSGETFRMRRDACASLAGGGALVLEGGERPRAASMAMSVKPPVVDRRRRRCIRDMGGAIGSLAMGVGHRLFSFETGWDGRRAG